MSKKANVQFMGDAIGKQVQAHYEKVMSEHAEKWDTDVVFVLCHGDHAKAPKEMDFDKFYIFIQLLPKDFEGVKRTSLKHLMLDKKKLEFPLKEGTTKSCPQGDSLKFSNAPKEAKIICDEEGTPMATIYDSALYIANDFIHCRSKKELDISVKIFNYILDKAVNKTDFLKHLKGDAEEKSKRALAHAVKKGFKQRLDKEKIQLQAAKDTVKQYLKGIVDCERKALTAGKMITALNNNLSDIPSAIEKTWLELKKMEGSSMYNSISFMKTGLKAITTPITIKHNKNAYDMGKFEITVNFNGEVEMKSLTGGINGHDHPHVNRGRPCWGNMAGTLPKLIGFSEFDVALVMVHTFLCNYDAGNPYQSIDSWPKKKEEEKE